MRTTKKCAVLLLLCFVCILSSCKSSRINFSMYVNAIPVNLDPQIASTPSEITSVLHLYNGLFRKGPDGKVVAACAEDYTVSGDGLVYTISIKENLFWQSCKLDGKEVTLALTADDFVFGLTRVFQKDTKSPYATALSTIQNADAVLSGRMEESALGVKALDAHTLQITLAHPDPLFIERLCLPGAMPCNRTFFASTGGAYGLSGKTTLGNGNFELVTWQKNSGIGMQNTSAKRGAVNYLRLVLPETRNAAVPPLKRLADGITDGELMHGYIADERFSVTHYATTVWSLAFNCENRYLQNVDIRTALAASAQKAHIPLDEKSLIPCEGLVPPSITMLDQDYRSYAGNTMPICEDPAAIYRSGLSQLGISKVSGLTVLVPDSGDYAEIFADISQQWQKDLSVFFSVKALSNDALLAAVASGNYDIALLPLEQSENDVYSLLARFKTGKADNAPRFSNPPYDEMLREIEQTRDARIRADLFVQAEKYLLSQAPLVPLFYETDTFLYSADISGLVISPYGPVVDISFAVKAGE
jgi:ABC-type oligopeptide transport system substrate-binding subunit